MADARIADEALASAAQVAPKMALDEIYLVRSTVERMPQASQAEEVELRSSFGFKAEHAFDEEVKTLMVMAHFYSHGHFEENGERKDLFHIEASFIVGYRLVGEGQTDGPEVEAFAKLNGIYNAWPYWREYMQSTTVRMGLPPMTLPLITAPRIQRMLEEQSKKERAENDASASIEGEQKG